MSKLYDILKNARHAVFFGGAGVSTASGIPDFRGKNGIYNTENSLGLDPEEIISHDFFINRTKDFYGYYKENMLYPEAKCNSCHTVLAELEEKGIIKSVITQNIDGLHERAGSKKVYNLHGSVYKNRCMNCGKSYPIEYVLSTDGVPHCSCGGIIKPEVVLYGEPLDDEVWYKAVAEIEAADVLIVAGSSLTVVPASYLVGMFVGKLVIINATPTPYDGKAALIIRENIAEVFKNLGEEIK